MVMIRNTIFFSLPIWIVFILDALFFDGQYRIPSLFLEPGMFIMFLSNPTWEGIHDYKPITVALFNCLFYFYVVLGIVLTVKIIRKTRVTRKEILWVVILAVSTVLTIGFLGFKNLILDRPNLQEVLADYEEILQKSLDAEVLQPYFCTAADGSPYPVVIVDDAIFWLPRLPRIEKFGKPVKFMTSTDPDTADTEDCFWEMLISISTLDKHTWATMLLYDLTRNVDFWASFDKIDGKWQIKKSGVDSVSTENWQKADSLLKRARQLRESIIESRKRK